VKSSFFFFFFLDDVCLDGLGKWGVLQVPHLGSQSQTWQMAEHECPSPTVSSTKFGRTAKFQPAIVKNAVALVREMPSQASWAHPHAMLGRRQPDVPQEKDAVADLSPTPALSNRAIDIISRSRAVISHIVRQHHRLSTCRNFYVV